jgi:transcriptional antiterminator RfaH
MRKSLDKWFICFTKPKAEHKAKGKIEEQGYFCYLPMLITENVYGDKKEEPLFSRYLFFKPNPLKGILSISPVKSTPGVSHILAFNNEPAQIDDDVIQAIQSKTSRVIQSDAFTKGQPIKIQNAHLDDLEAIFEMKNGHDRAWVLIKMMGHVRRLNLPLNALSTL